MIRVLFAPEARREFEEAQRYYERQFPGLGTRFRDEVRDGVARMRTWPLACPVERGDIRRMPLLRFPYKLMYSIESDHIYVIAVAHSHRAPDYWQQRQSGVSEP